MSVVLPIEEDQRFRRYTATANQIQFGVPFPFQQNSDIAIFLEAENGALSPISPTLYALSGANDAEGGMATFTTGRAAGEKIVVLGRAVLDRLSSIVTNGRFSSYLTDGELDRNRIIQQEQSRDLGRALKSPLGMPGLELAADLQDGDTFMREGDRIVKGPDASLIASAQGYAEVAQGAAQQAGEDRDLAEIARQAAEAAAAGVSLPPVTANTLLVDNAAGSARQSKAFFGSLDASEIIGLRRVLDRSFSADRSGAGDTSDAWESAAAAGGVVYVRAGTYKLTKTVNIAAPVTFIIESGAVISVAHDGAGFTVTSSDVYFIGFGKAVIEGPRTGTEYLASSKAFSFDGTDNANRLSHLTVQGLEIRNFKEGAIRATYCDDIRVNGNIVYDCTYMGVFFLSCNRSWFEGNHVYNIAPGTSGIAPYLNAYGVSWTANGAGDTPCADFWCNGNVIEDITSWTGIDTHGGQRGIITGNTVTECYIGIGVTVLAATVAPNQIIVERNYVLGLAVSGVVTDAGTVYPGPGISLAGIQGGVRTQNNSVSHNRLILCGFYNGTNWHSAISLQSTQGTNCHGNVLVSCRSMAIGTFYVNFGLDIAGNSIQELTPSAAENPIGIWVSSDTNVISLRANRLIRGSATGTAYLYTVAAQSGGWHVDASRDSFTHNATKWSPGSMANVVDLGAAL